MDDIADRLVVLYERSFGGKAKGRFRIANKLVRSMMNRKRLYETDVEALKRAMIERGFVLIDMESFFVILSANTFVNYRRANEDCLV